MALAAVVGVIIFNVVMAVQTFQTIGVCVRLVGEKNFARFVLKHQTYWVLRGRGCERCVAYNSCDQKNDHNQYSYF